MQKSKLESNALIIFGGGLVDPAKYILMRIAMNLSTIYSKVFIGKYSFESLYTPEYMCFYDKNLIQLVSNKRGTFFGTSRDINLYTDTERLSKAITCLKEHNIKTIIVAGGDGSSRQVAETSNLFKEHGINIIYLVPLTIDGINGSASIGNKEATLESIRQIENLASTALQTRADEQWGVAVVEVQGRNRDDILANVLKHFDTTGQIADISLEDINLKVVPANFHTDFHNLIRSINHSSKRTLVLLSEGAKKHTPVLCIEDISKIVARKVRSVVVGHQSQSNNMTTIENIEYYNQWVDAACKFVLTDPYGSFCVAKNGESFSKKPINFFAKLNPRENQKAYLSKSLTKLIHIYMNDDCSK